VRRAACLQGGVHLVAADGAGELGDIDRLHPCEDISEGEDRLAHLSGEDRVEAVERVEHRVALGGPCGVEQGGRTRAWLGRESAAGCAAFRAVQQGLGDYVDGPRLHALSL